MNSIASRLFTLSVDALNHINNRSLSFERRKEILDDLGFNSDKLIEQFKTIQNAESRP